MKRSVLLLVILGVFAFCAPVSAVPVTMQFTAEDFTDLWSIAPAPTDPVTGTIVWDADSIYDPIKSLSSISLTIDGHTYGISEVGFLSPFETLPSGQEKDVIGGVINGVDTMIVGVGPDDFWISWNRTLLSPLDFSYVSANTVGYFQSHYFTSFSITAEAAVPEPATMLLLGTGLVGLVGFRRKFRKN